jgi:hypothetical protein
VLVSTGRDSVRFTARGTSDTVWLATPTLARLDVAQGRRGHAKRGALVGAGLGMLVGAVVTITQIGETSCGSATLGDGTVVGGLFCSTIEAGDIPFYSVAMGLLAAPVGALVGASVRSDRWVPVLLPDAGARVRTGARTSGSVGLGVSRTFGAP